ncbi:Uncharacterised protein [Chlamydia trachomatis]|nr:Uncharacterised protein [Chlamydia trachomatis]
MESYLNKYVKRSPATKSLIATTSMGEFLFRICLKTNRPIRPKPLITILIAKSQVVSVFEKLASLC